MPPYRHRVGLLLPLTVCATLVLSSCTGDEGTNQAGTEDEQAPNQWGDTPGVVVHSEDRETLFVLDPETGEEIDILDPEFGEDSPSIGFRSSGELFTTAFSPNFRYMARITERRGKVEVHDLAEQEPVWQYESESENLSSTNRSVDWVGFSVDSENLFFYASDSDGISLNSVDFTDGGEPEEVGSGPSESEGGAAGWTWSHEYLAGEGYSHQHDGEDGEIIEVEGVDSGTDIVPTYVRIWTGENMVGPNEEYEDFVRTEDGTYIGAKIDRTGKAGNVEPDVGHLIELTFDEEGEVSEWSEIAEAAGIDAFALSPDQEQIAVSKKGDVFLLPADGSDDESRLDEDGSQDYRVLGWF